ncbi:hypothetical protein, partial [Xanthomonas oryzae]
METSLRVDEVLDGLLHLLRMAAGGLHPTVEDIDATRRDRAAHRHRRVCDVEVILRSLGLAYRVFETPDRIARLTRISVDAQRRLALAADHLLAGTEAIAVALTGAGGRGAGWHDAGSQTVAAAVRV